jgi:hypothetical protein
MLKTFEIEDDLERQDLGAIEVILHLEDGRRRWCYFMTPRALINCGDWIDGTTTPIHYDAPYMIVVSGRLDTFLIERFFGKSIAAGNWKPALCPWRWARLDCLKLKYLKHRRKESILRLVWVK